ncbi:MAG: Hpt domain-containing response regulator [Planctomycetota bacterium]|jgi:two-component system OmpR family response regulator
MRVLVVDDSEMVRNVLSAMLRKLGHEAIAAGTAAEALAAEGYGMVLLDHSLPDRPGAEVADELRMRGSDVPIYGITGHDNAAELCAGMDGHVRKPFKLHDIAALVGLARARVELGSANIVKIMLRGVVDEVPKLLEQLHQTDDAGEVHRLAHTINGSMRFVEAPKARDAAARLEQAAKQGSIDNEARDLLTREVGELLPRLEELLG